MSSMRRESKPPRYMLMVCRTKEAMPRSICPALALPCAPALLASCRKAEVLRLLSALFGAELTALRRCVRLAACARASLGLRSQSSHSERLSQATQHSA